MANEAKQFTIGGITHDVMDVGARQLISDLQTAIDALTGGDTTTAIKTFQEVIDFLDGVTDDQTLVGELNELRTLIAAKVDKVTGKGLSTEDYTTVEKSKLGALPTKAELDASLADAGKVKSVTINGTKHTPDTQSGDVNLGTVVGEKGEKGDQGDTLLVDGNFNPITDIVNDTTTGGTKKAWSAEMGKRVSAQVDALEDAVEEMEDGAGYDISIVGQQLVITSRNRPSVAVGEVSNHNVACKAGNTATASFYVSGRKLASAIQIAVSDATNWQVSPASISPVDGKVALTLVTITYRPAAGTASGTTHTCNVTVTCGGVTYGTIAMQGTVAAAPSITLTPATLNITTASGTPATATVNVKGSALEGDIALAISGTGFTISTNSVAKADAESAAGADVTVTFDGSAAGTATITATATGAAAATAEVNGAIPTPLAEGSYFDIPIPAGGALRYTVLADGNVSVKGLTYNNTDPTSTVAAPLTIPATVTDDDAVAVYGSDGTAISASGVTYNVTEIAAEGFKNSLGTNLKSIIISEGITTINNGAFQMSGDYTSRENILHFSLPSTLSSAGSGNAFTFYYNNNLAEIEFKSDAIIGSYSFTGCKGLRKVILDGNPMENNIFSSCSQFSATSGDKPVVINRAAAYTYRPWSGAKPFPENENNKVWAKLYCPDVAGYTAAGWPFDEILDINDYNE